jgi:hypothetical protein
MVLIRSRFALLLSVLCGLPGSLAGQDASSGFYFGASVAGAAFRWDYTPRSIVPTATIEFGTHLTAGLAVGPEARIWRAGGDPYAAVGLITRVWPTHGFYVAGGLAMAVYVSQPFAEEDIRPSREEGRVTEMGPAYTVRVGYEVQTGKRLMLGPYAAYTRTLGGIQSPYDFELLEIGLGLRIQ